MAAEMIWRELARLGTAAKNLSFRELFACDPERFQRFSVRANDMLLDFSKTALTDASLAALFDLARATNVEVKRDTMFAGKVINSTEGRAVLHTALRNRSNCPVMVEGRDVMPDVNAVLASMGAMAATGYVIERAVINPILGQPSFSVVMLTIGIGYVLRGLVTMIPGIGTDTHVLAVPYKDQTFQWGGLMINAEQAVVVVVTALLCLALFGLFKYSKLGIAMQAMSQNQLAAYYMGIPVKRLNSWVWALAATVAAVAGLLLAPITFVHANMGFIGLKAFPAAVVGGFGSLPGAIVGGLVIGVVESLSGFYLPDGFKDTAAYIVVLLMLMVMPNGLFGQVTRKKV
jgi:branched-chain amino acid transport system permease protein